MTENKPTIGFIGQGWIGKNYADDFENRGFAVVRYAKEEPYAGNKEKIKDCDIVFIAVPTPTTPDGFNDGIVRSVISLARDGATVVIKSTILPGTTESIQKEHSQKTILHCPEFLTESTAKKDVEKPERNIIGIPEDTTHYREKAHEILDILPEAPFCQICLAREAELLKYIRNCFFYTKVVYMNMAYDLAQKLGCSWEELVKPMMVDPWIGPMHNQPIHKSGRGAGGHCLIKDYAAFSEMYKENVDDLIGQKIMDDTVAKNIDLLKKSGKDLELLKGVYGDEIIDTDSKN